ncbi:MAG: maltotransferase domain-containing protein [Pirellulales bacterium]
MPQSQLADGTRRVAIENVEPSIDGGRFAVKRVVGDRVVITADVFADGHDVVVARLLYRRRGAADWIETPLAALGNDAWQAELVVAETGAYEFTIVGWVDPFETWRRDLEKRVQAGQDVAVDLQIGGQLVAAAVDRAAGKQAREDAARLRYWQETLAAGATGLQPYLAGAAEVLALMERHPDRTHATRCPSPFSIVVDAPKAVFSTWYELFPRSCASQPGQHGTLADCINWLPRLAELGFDVVYLPPIHPVGTTFRKGKNNAVNAEPGDVGSPWAIGSPDGGHKAIHPQLGTLADLERLISAAGERGIDIALDIAFQCSPDHPYVREHPTWFRQRPDGTVQYAENPPKKYQDIYPFDFETADWQALWRELTDVFLYWAARGVRIFRVDNPHTKPFAFWEYLIGEVKAQYPDAIFLSEAFTRPKIMYRLAKLGFTQSYTYFTWRTGKAEIAEYFTELTQTKVREFFRPNLWPNTPDILPGHLQTLGRPAFIARLVMAATLGANYGIYGPAFETLEHAPREPGSEEYLNSEKYELRRWNFDAPEAIGPVIANVNRIRRENLALQSNDGLHFHVTDNEHLLCYSKRDAESGNRIVVVVNLAMAGIEHGFVTLDLAALGIDADRPYQVRDLLSATAFTWQGSRNFVKLDAQLWPAHILLLEQA